MRTDEAARLRRGLLAAGAALAVLVPAALGPTGAWRGTATVQADRAAAPAPPPTPPARPRYAHFGSATPSPDARHVADWVADTGDNAGSAFVIVDKKFATLYVFDAEARMRGVTPVLLGAAVGDDSAPGIGTRPLSQVRPDERTTPAGRFMAERGHNALGHDVVWVDYDAAVSMHRVRTSQPSEHRLQRLATPTVDDKRISYGCINVPVAFYDSFIRPTFATQRAPVYVLPEVKPVQQVFGSYEVAAAHDAAARRASAPPATAATLALGH
jgi:hypothetical protein